MTRTRITRARKLVLSAAGFAALAGIGLLGIAFASVSSAAFAAGTVPASPSASGLASYIGGYSEYSTCVGISTAAPCSTRGLAGGDDIGGAVAVDGNLQATDFSIGDGLSGSLALSVNANVSGTLEIGNVSSGNYGVYGGSDSAATLPNGSTPIPNLYATSSTYPLPDFSTLNGELSTLSTTWGDATTYPTNGTMTTTVPGTLYLVGTDSSLDVFNLTAGQLAATVDLYINVPDGASVLVNVPDTSVDCTVTSCLNNVYYWDGSAYEPGTQYNNTYVEDVRGNTLLNFYNATSISLSTAGPAINILAPQASFTFDNGQMSGFVYADSVNGDFENDLPGGAVVPPPTPPTTAPTTTTTALTTTTTALTTTTTALTTTATTMPVVPNTVGTTTTTPVVPNTVGTTTTTTAPTTTATAPTTTTTTAPTSTTTAPTTTTVPATATTTVATKAHNATTTTAPAATTTTAPAATTTTAPAATTTTAPAATTTTAPAATTTTAPAATTTTTAPAATTTTTARTHASHATTTTTGPKVTTTTGPKVTTTTGPRVTTSTTVPSVTTTTVPSVTTTTVPSKKLAFTGFDSGGMIGLGAALLLGGLGVIALSYRRRPMV